MCVVECQFWSFYVDKLKYMGQSMSVLLALEYLWVVSQLVKVVKS